MALNATDYKLVRYWFVHVIIQMISPEIDTMYYS